MLKYVIFFCFSSLFSSLIIAADIPHAPYYSQFMQNTMYDHGMKYLTGLGGTKNTSYAKDFFKTAAKNGHEKAQFNLSALDLVPKGLSLEDVVFLEDAAEKNYEQAQYMLALYYLSEQPSHENQDLWIYWLNKAALNHHYEAQIKLAEYSNRNDDIISALKYYTLASKQGCLKSKMFIVNAYKSSKKEAEVQIAFELLKEIYALPSHEPDVKLTPDLIKFYNDQLSIERLKSHSYAPLQVLMAEKLEQIFQAHEAKKKTLVRDNSTAKPAKVQDIEEQDSEPEFSDENEGDDDLSKSFLFPEE